MHSTWIAEQEHKVHVCKVWTTGGLTISGQVFSCKLEKNMDYKCKQSPVLSCKYMSDFCW